MKDFYRRFLVRPQCLAIASPFSSTLSEIGAFFDDPEITARLRQTPLALHHSYWPADGEKFSTLSFFFQAPDGWGEKRFLQSGCATAVKLAGKIVAEYPDARFFFCARRPDEDELAAAGISSADFMRLDRDNILWIEKFNSPEKACEILARCHFSLMPGFETGSFPVMAALAAGALPVMTDLPPIAEQLAGKDYVILASGVKSQVPLPPVCPDAADKFRQAVLENSELILDSLVQALKPVLAKPAGLPARAAAAQAAARQDFAPNGFRSWLESIISENRQAIEDMAITEPFGAGGSGAGGVGPLGGEAWLRDITPSDFEGQAYPAPVIWASKKRFLFRHQHRYRIVDSAESWQSSHFWSPFVQGGESLPDLHSALDKIEDRKIHSNKKQIVNPVRIASFLMPHPAFYNISRYVYRALRKMRLLK